MARLKQLRSHLRQNMPAPEVVLWQKLRKNQLGIRFRRQYLFDNYILDFFAPQIKLAVEVDGDSHYRNPKAILNDMVRDQNLERNGIRVLRFTNLEVMANLDGALSRITEEVKSRTPSSLPLLRKGRN